MKKKFICFILLFIVCIALVIPITNAYTPVEEILSQQPFVNFTTPYDMTYKFISEYSENDNYTERYSFIDSQKSFVLDSNGSIYESNVYVNHDNDDFYYNLSFESDAGDNGGLMSVRKAFEVVTYGDHNSGFVGYLSGILRTVDFLNFLDCYFIEYYTENLVVIDFASQINVTLSVPINNDPNNTLTKTFTYNDATESASSSYHYYSLKIDTIYDDLLTLYNDYSIEYLYFNAFISFDLSFFEYSGEFFDSLYIGEYVVLGNDYEPSVEAYRSVFGGYVVEEVINPDFSSWLVTGVGSFMNFEIIPGWSIAVILSVMIGIPLLIYILRLFFGG